MGIVFEKKISFVGPGHQELFPLSIKSDVSYKLKIDIKKTNTIVSNLYVKSGTGTIDVKYYNFTTDGDNSEKQQICSHGIVDATTGPINNIKIAALANKPYAEIIITGTVEFSLFVNALQASPTLVLDKNSNIIPLSSIDGKLEVYSYLASLEQGGKNGQILINNTEWTDLTPIPLLGRKALNIQNPSQDIKVKLNFDNTAIGFNGITIYPESERFYTCSENVKVYAKSESGSFELDIEEVI